MMKDLLCILCSKDIFHTNCANCHIDLDTVFHVTPLSIDIWKTVSSPMCRDCAEKAYMLFKITGKA